MRTTRPLFAFALLLAPAAAQTQNIAWFKDSSPTLGGGNAFPFGSEGVRYQTIVPRSVIGGPAIIQDLFVAGRSRDAQIVYGDIEIRMGITQLPSPVANWNQNNPNPTTVYRGPLRIVFKNGVWGGIGMPNFYVYAPTGMQDNLCIEVIVWQVLDMGGGTPPNFYLPLAGTAASPGGPVPRTFLFQWAQGGGFANMTTPQNTPDFGCKVGLLLNDGNMVVAGTSCQGSSSNFPSITSAPGTWPQVNSSFNVLLANGRPNSVALLTLGNSDIRWGTLNLPIDLVTAGAPSCFVWNNYLHFLSAPVDASGGAMVSLPIPVSANLFRVLASWINFDPGANAAGITTSDYARLILGT